MADVGGNKRLKALSTCFSVIILAPWAIFNLFTDTLDPSSYATFSINNLDIESTTIEPTHSWMYYLIPLLIMSLFVFVIDFYVEFQKDPKTQRDYIIYDNTNKVKNRPYKICNLHVGKITGNQERPTPFILNNGYSEAYLFLEDGEKEVRDLDGEIILGGTVVEFAYNNDPSLAPRQRWVPMRTRHDKTSFVERYRRKYGNYITVAENVWRSIMNPINMSDFADLSIGSSKYHDKINELNSKVDRSTVIAASNEKQYYVSNKL